MKRQLFSGFLVISLLISMLGLASNIRIAKAGTLIVPDDYPTIQAAINAASSGATIYVRAGIYYENVVINKTVSLFGENKSTTIIDGSGTGTVVAIGQVSGVAISNFTIQNSGDYPNYCISLYRNASNNTISGNIITKCKFGGIFVFENCEYNLISENEITSVGNQSAIDQQGGSHSIIRDNNVTGCAEGIHLFNSHDNIISNNRIVNCSAQGLSLLDTSHNTLRNNTLAGNGWRNFDVVGEHSISELIHDIDTSNKVEGKPIYYLVNQTNLTIDPPSFPNIGFLAIVNSTDITVKDLTAPRRNGAGITLAYTNSSTLQNLTVTENGNGIFLTHSNNNTLARNEIFNNGDGIFLYTSTMNQIINNNITNSGGVFLRLQSTNNVVRDNKFDANGVMPLYIGDESNNNAIYHNNFFDHYSEVNIYDSTGTWDDGYPSGGNYWSDYTTRYPNAAEIDNSGLWNTPYVIDANNTDNYPLISPWGSSDIAVVKIAPYSTTVYSPCPVFISTTIENRGNKSESIRARVCANNMTVGTKDFTIQPHTNFTFTTMWNTLGFSGEYAISAYAEPLEDEINTSNNRLVDGTVDVMGKGYFVIVAGNRQDNELLPTINNGCNQVYKILRQVGYSADSIYYLNQPECGSQDLDKDGKNDIDNWASSTNLRWAIETWAASRVGPTQPLYLYLFDHGGSDIFCIDNAPDYVYSSQLDSWLDNLEGMTGAPINVIYAACHSGSFIDELSGAGRVIITSSKAEEFSWIVPGTWEAFSTPFWNQVKSGHSVGSSFSYACSPHTFWAYLWRLIGRGQTPLLDDNADGVGHTGSLPSGGDGYLANNIYIGACEWPYPWISEVMPSLFSYWPPQSNTTLWARVENNTNLLHVRAFMLLLGWVPPNSTDTLAAVATECYEMSDSDNDGNWTVSIPAINFTNHAAETLQAVNFTFLIVAEQDNGDFNTPSVVDIRFSKTLDFGVDEIPPYVGIERPLENRIVSGTVAVNGTALDDVCLKDVEVYIDDSLCGTMILSNVSSSFYEFSLDTTLFENGNRTITVRASDTSNNHYNQTLNVVFENFVHDTAVTNVVHNKRIVGQGYVSHIEVTTANHGSYPENTNLTIYANETCIASQTILLANGNYTNLFFNWSTTGFAYGNYTISAYAEPVLNETYIADNNLTCIIPVHVGVSGDVSGPTQGIYDGTTNMRDIQYLILLFNTKPSSPNWNPNADVNNDGTVNMRDIQIAILNFNQHE